MNIDGEGSEDEQDQEDPFDAFGLEKFEGWNIEDHSREIFYLRSRQLDQTLVELDRSIAGVYDGSFSGLTTGLNKLESDYQDATNRSNLKQQKQLTAIDNMYLGELYSVACDRVRDKELLPRKLRLQFLTELRRIKATRKLMNEGVIPLPVAENEQDWYIPMRCAEEEEEDEEEEPMHIPGTFYPDEGDDGDNTYEPPASAMSRDAYRPRSRRMSSTGRTSPMTFDLLATKRRKRSQVVSVPIILYMLAESDISEDLVSMKVIDAIES